MRKLVPTLVVGFLVFLQNALAQESTFELDPAKTQIEFVLPTTLHTVHGSFRVKSGTIHFDPSTGAASGLVLVDATSGESGSEGRDRRMHKEILESDKYPDITFVPNRVIGRLAPQGDSTLQVQGTFRLHGNDHPIDVSIPLHISGGEVTANYHFVVPYVQWGLKNPSKFVLRVNDKVEVNVTASGHLTQAVARR
jgi:polyisoprenoid-binding protein YceI